MHHTKEFTKYSFQKKTWLIVALMIKIIVFGTLFIGVFFLLKNYISPILLFVFLHIILLACLLIFLYVHKLKSHGSHDHESQIK